MKNLMTILGLLMIPFLASANFSLDDGKYYNQFLDKRIRVNSTANSILVKNLVSYDWRRFRRCGHGIYEDRRGNRITVTSYESFEFRGRGRKRIRLNFQRISLGDRIICSISCGPGCPACHGNYAPPPPVYDYEPQVRPSSGLEGVWANSRYESDVIIERTNEGLRAKIIGSNRDWTYYRQDSYDKKEYYDNRGNRYVRRTSGELVWYPKEGGSPIILRKIR